MNDLREYYYKKRFISFKDIHLFTPHQNATLYAPLALSPLQTPQLTPPVCPTCSNILTVSPTPVSSSPSPEHAGLNRLECLTCPYQYILQKAIYDRKTFKREEKEDVFGGPGMWDNADKTEKQCTVSDCDGMEATVRQVQIRSADEPMTSFFRCMKCGAQWREN
ncbi:hypothetical protein ACMFMF_005259 [Clarireedia jacksonii]